jgi:hypothetical protein
VTGTPDSADTPMGTPTQRLVTVRAARILHVEFVPAYWAGPNR